jgi:hypothetical protein
MLKPGTRSGRSRGGTIESAAECRKNADVALSFYNPHPWTGIRAWRGC